MQTSPSPSPSRRVRIRQWCSALALGTLVLTGVAACGGSNPSTTTTSGRPHTSAKLLIISPTPNQVTGPNVLVQFRVEGATVSPAQKDKLVANEGHIHVSVDGRLIVMAYRTSTQLNGLSPGLHTLQAEFVANDHLSFANRVIAVVLFTVKS